MASTVQLTGQSPADLDASFARLRAAVHAHGAPSYETRRQWLDALANGLRAYASRFVEAANADFGTRSRHETLMADMYLTLATIKAARKSLRRWMRPVRVKGSLLLAPASVKLVYEPLGVVGIIAPWNYPVNLALAPLAEALAAGNRVLLKPSEQTPATSEVMRELIDAELDADVASVVLGDAQLGQAFSRLPFDHLVFTGSTAVGRQVMRAAAENLTPVTLELGGKSPVIVHESYDVRRAAESVGWGKCFNAGQTCVAPDYVLVHESKLDAFASELAAAIGRYYPYVLSNSAYTSIINAKHWRRLNDLVADARERGAEVRAVHPADETFDEASRKVPPTLLVRATPEMKVMQEEIFGPLLPILPYRNLDEAIAFVNARPKPLAFYYFDGDAGRANHVIARTTSGGATINDVLLHFCQEHLGRGGVGASGMGLYHGYEGFKNLSNARAVMEQSPLSQARLLRPPYTPLTDKIVRWMLG